MSKAFLTDIHTKNELTECPIIIQFQNGTLNENTLYKKSLTCLKNIETNKKEAFFAINSNIYQGVVEENNELTDNFIAIRNKVTKKVRLIQVDRALLTNQVLIEKETATSINRYDNDLAKKLLLKKFGGKRASKHLQRVERMKVNVNTIKDQLEATMENTVEDDENEVNSNTILSETSIVDIVPPFNKDASSLDDVYNLTDVIPKTLLERLNEEAQEVLVTEEAIPISSEHLLNKIIEIRKSAAKASLENLTKIKIFIYMDGLMSLLKSRARNMAKTNLSKITEKVENDIRLRFSPKDSMKAIRTAYSSDKALCYFITLALLTSPKYEIDINILMKELSKPRKKIVQYAQLVHAKLKSNSDVLALRLPEPIKNLKIFNRRR